MEVEWIIRNDKVHYLKLATNHLLSTTDNLKDMQ